jgi:hypothetical protein
VEFVRSKTSVPSAPSVITVPTWPVIDIVIPGNEVESEINRLVMVHRPIRQGSPIGRSSTAVVATARAVGLGAAVTTA